LSDLLIRSEQVKDFHSIAVVNAITFTYGFGMGEVSLVSVLRNRKEFDPDLSLVAELNGKIVGHILFTPQRIRVNGEILDAVIVGPLVVLPKFQNQGVGSQLIREGHKRAEQKGFQMAILTGHPTYYPRFGYQTKMWGSHHIQISLENIPPLNQSVAERRLKKRDIQELKFMWENWYKDAKLAILPGESLTDWISPSIGIQTSAVIIDNELSGYLRYDKNNPKKVICVLAKDNNKLMNICSYLKEQITKITSNNNDQEKVLTLPIPTELDINLPHSTEVKAGPIRMIKILAHGNQNISDYFDSVANERQKPCHLIMPVEFDVC
jgi:predicted N-acetyltransferase YhbS